jgi:hypothetical protein
MRIANQSSRMMFCRFAMRRWRTLIETLSDLASFEPAVECLATLLSDYAMQNNSIFALDFTEVRE